MLSFLVWIDLRLARFPYLSLFCLNLKDFHSSQPFSVNVIVKGVHEDQTQGEGPVMSLAEIPLNHIRRNAQLRQLDDGLQQSRLQTAVQNGVKNLAVPQKSSPIQSMLKNTTEIGDVGQFSSKPPRVPFPVTQLSPARSRKVRLTPSRRRHQAPFHNGQNGYSAPYGIESFHQGSIASNGPGFDSQFHSGPYQRPSLEDYRSFSMTQGSYNQPNLSPHHLHTNGHHPRQRDIDNIRPRSPYTYSTRLKRPGYRPSSPALSDVNKPMVGYAQGLSRHPSNRTASPLSAFNMSRTPSPFHHVINHSDPDLQHYPPYLVMESKGSRRPSITSSRPSTPKPSPSVSSVRISSHMYRKPAVTSGSGARPRSPPNSPIFYDYTEDFEEHDSFQDPSLSTRILSEQTMPIREPSTYSELDGNPESLSIAELPSAITPTELTTQADELGLDQSASDVNSTRYNYTTGAPQDLSDVPELPEKELAATELEVPVRDFPVKRHSYHQTLQLDFPQALDSGKEVLLLRDGNHRKSSPEAVAALTDPIMSRNPDPRPTLPTEPMFTFKSSTPPKPPPLAVEPGNNLFILAGTHKFPTAGPDDDERETPDRVDTMHPSESIRGPSLEGHSKLSTEILSPTPERSTIAPSNRDRFSKILSIEEDILDTEPFVPPLKREERIDTPMQAIRSIDAWEAGGKLGHFRHQRPRFTRDSPLKQGVATEVLAEKSDSEEEPELTIGLRQTFCKEEKVEPQLNQLWPPNAISSQGLDHNTTQAANMEQPLENREVFERPPTPPQVPYIKTAENIGSIGKTSAHATGVVLPLDISMSPPRQPKKQPSFRSYSPPSKPQASELPFDFTPLVRQSSEDDSLTPVHAVPPSDNESDTTTREVVAAKITPAISEIRSDGDSVGSLSDSLPSRPASRPWNHDSSYPWCSELPELEVMIPKPIHDPPDVRKPPRFKLNVQRASSSTGGTSKIKNELKLFENCRGPFASSLDLGQGPAFRRKRNPNLSVLPGQTNSSHDILHAGRQRTRFVDTFETQSPTVSLLVPSPNFEARSFFSDDSSQIRPKGVLRKRFSEFRARTAGSRGTSVDDARGYDRGLLSSALGRSRASGRSSRQSQNTAGTSTRTSIARRMRWKMMNKIRLWVHRGEDKVRDWKWKMRYRNGKNRAASAPVYANA